MSSSSYTITGKVKWFNSKAGYGFITACDGEHADKDIFVHFSSIKADSAHYKYLTQGEYVDFVLTKPANEKHEYHAVDVTGVKGGLIMCETRRLSAISSRSDEYVSTSELDSVPATAPVKTVNYRKPRPTTSRAEKSVDADGFIEARPKSKTSRPRVSK